MDPGWGDGVAGGDIFQDGRYKEEQAWEGKMSLFWHMVNFYMDHPRGLSIRTLNTQE